MIEKHNKFNNVYIFNHSLMKHKLNTMRNKETSAQKFRHLMKEISLLMGYEVTRNLPLCKRTIQTPFEELECDFIISKQVVIVPILRAGLGLVDGLLSLIPSAQQGHIGLYREESTKKPIEYYVRLPKGKNKFFILADPLVATGNSAAASIKVMLDHEIQEKDIVFLSLISCPEGLTKISAKFPKVKIYTASIDRELNSKAYILPGIGDAGDRLFGTD